MPISLSAKKSLRKSLKNHKDNVSFKNTLKTTVKEFLAKPTAEGLKGVYSILDKAVKKGIFHKNKTSRLKASYAKKVKGGTTATKAVVKKAVKKTKTAKSKSAKKM